MVALAVAETLAWPPAMVAVVVERVAVAPLTGLAV
jgi:hypothetical protein